MKHLEPSEIEARRARHRAWSEDEFLDYELLGYDASTGWPADFEARVAAEARVRELEWMIRHAVQSTHGHKPDACSGCGQIAAILAKREKGGRIMSEGAHREVTLEEWVGKLPKSHLATREYREMVPRAEVRALMLRAVEKAYLSYATDGEYPVCDKDAVAEADNFDMIVDQVLSEAKE